MRRFTLGIDGEILSVDGNPNVTKHKLCPRRFPNRIVEGIKLLWNFANLLCNRNL